jgi:hypothetical protein
MIIDDQKLRRMSIEEFREYERNLTPQELQEINIRAKKWAIGALIFMIVSLGMLIYLIVNII